MGKGILKKLFVTILAIASFGISANASDVIDASSMPANVLFAHRGYHEYVPENTIDSFIAARNAGFCWFETDVRESADGEYFIMHNSTVNKMTNGTGEIGALSSSYIKSLKINYGAGASSKIRRVPTLTDTLNACKTYGVKPVLHLCGVKNYNKMLNICKRYSFYKNIIFMGEYGSLKAIRSLDPDIRLMGVNWPVESLEACLKKYAPLNIYALNICRSHYTSYSDKQLLDKYNVKPCIWNDSSPQFSNSENSIFADMYNDCYWFVTDNVTPNDMQYFNWFTFQWNYDLLRIERSDIIAKKKTEKKANALMPLYDFQASTFTSLKAFEKSMTSSWIKLSWSKSSSKKYHIYGGPYTSKLKYLGSTSGTTFTVRGLSTMQYYKFVIFGTDQYGEIDAISKSIYAINGGLTYCNCNEVIADKKVTLKPGKSHYLNPIIKKGNPKATMTNIVPIRYESANKTVATVTTFGKINAKRPGWTTIYTIAPNGRHYKTSVEVTG